MTEHILARNPLDKKKTVLVFGAHPDDFEVGCAGTILKYLNDINLYIYIMSDRYEDGKKRNLNDLKRKYMILTNY